MAFTPPSPFRGTPAPVEPPITAEPISVPKPRFSRPDNAMRGDMSRIPKAVPRMFKKGGKVRKTGLALVHKGETITPAKHSKASSTMSGKRKSPKMNAARRKSLPKSKFGLPGKRKYPVDTPGRAANAKARATQMVKKGKLSSSAAAKIKSKANKALGKSA